MFARCVAVLSLCSLAFSAAVDPAAQPAPPGSVKLLPGPFLDALTINGEYLLHLSPDRLLADFRKQAGLPPKNVPYGGWEQTDIAGHSLGHYLSALSLQYGATRDPRFKERADYIVAELALCQKQNANGLVDAQTKLRPKVWDEFAAGKIEKVQRHNINGSWVPWYEIHKTYAGLRDAWIYTGNPQAKDVFLKLSDWTQSVVGNLSDAQMQTMLACEFGGMNEVLADAYAVSGKDLHLRLARKFDHKAVMDPLRRKEDPLSGLHANTQIPKIIGEARIYELTGDPSARTASEFFFETVLANYTYANGGNSNNEWFGKPKQLAASMGGSMTETCNTYNMLKLAMHLYSWQPSVPLMDYYERALYNQIYNSLDRRTGMYTYKLGLHGGWFQSWSDPEDSFWCCVGTGMENPGRFTDAVYFQKGNQLWVNLFIPSEFDWTAQGARIRQTTDFPREASTQLRVSLAKPTRLALNLRYPSWSGPAKLLVNGKPAAFTAKPGAFVTLDRVFNDGDTITFETPMSLRSEPTPDNPSRVAFFYGPVLLAGLLGTDNMPPAGPYGKQDSDDWKIPPVGAPPLAGRDKPLAGRIKPVPGKPLYFTTATASGKEILLVPIWDSHHQRFTAYWDVTN